MIKLTNTLGMQKELLVPVKESKIGMYVCGVTVYDLCHLGHARTFVAFDMIVRYLRFRGYLSLIHISEPTRLRRISYAVFCLKKKKDDISMA